MDVKKASVTSVANKLNSQLDEANAKIKAFAASAREDVRQGKLDAIKELKTLRDAISKKHDDLRTASEDKAIKIKSDIDVNLVLLHTSLESFVKRFQEHAKAS